MIWIFEFDILKGIDAPFSVVAAFMQGNQLHIQTVNKVIFNTPTVSTLNVKLVQKTT